MIFQQFVHQSGLKVLAMARLSGCEYSVVLYLLNCWASGHHDLITTKREISSLIGFPESDLTEALASLSSRNILKIKSAEKNLINPDNNSIRICVITNIDKWQLNFDEDVTSKDAIVFPFRRGGSLHLIKSEQPTDAPTNLADHRRNTETAESDAANEERRGAAAWQRVFASFADGRELTNDQRQEEEESAKILVETHPVDQILLMIRHLKERIPTLSLLASSWQHFDAIFDTETQKIDLDNARQKRHELDNALRASAEQWLTDKDQHKLSSEEVAVLDILAKHRHPRRQLFWAYQTRGRYPQLKGFFDQNSKHMLPITSTGSIVKFKPQWDS